MRPCPALSAPPSYRPHSSPLRCRYNTLSTGACASIAYGYFRFGRKQGPRLWSATGTGVRGAAVALQASATQHAAAESVTQRATTESVTQHAAAESP